MNKMLEQKAKELGQLITEMDEYKEVKVKQAALFEEEQALELLQEFQKLQKQNDSKQREGQLTNEDVQKTEQLELKMLDFNVIKELHESQTKFQNMLNLVMQTVIGNSK
ncbi:MAG: YlbF family regulator [Desulfotomaculum sp.]|nr:YlbF family regulator [Desulfotomaculum sp.]MCL0081603.1 YlbF family regulator [Peptococcaceae bacterium]